MDVVGHHDPQVQRDLVAQHRGRPPFVVDDLPEVVTVLGAALPRRA